MVGCAFLFCFVWIRYYDTSGCEVIHTVMLQLFVHVELGIGYYQSQDDRLQAMSTLVLVATKCFAIKVDSWSPTLANGSARVEPGIQRGNERNVDEGGSR